MRQAIDLCPPYSSLDVSAEDPFYNWPDPPQQIEHRLGGQDFDVRVLERIGDGRTAARKALLHFPDGATLIVKWKEFSPELDGWNNSPRKEIAAYEIQKWFLAPEQYIVPTTVARCVASEHIAAAVSPAPTIGGSRCKLVTLALWLRHVRPPKTYQPHRFRTEADYAFHVANFNVLATLIDNRDSRGSNVLVSDRNRPMRIYSVDNGMSFDPWFWKFKARPWNQIIVPGLPRTTVDRLRAVSESDYERLAVLVQMLRGDDGVYRNIEPTGPPLDPDRGVRTAGRLIQLGLTREEIREVRERVRSIVEQVDRGDIASF